MNVQITDKDRFEQTPYSMWLQTEILHTLQRTVSDHPGEYSFIVNCQVMELYWALIVRELQAAQSSLRQNDLAKAQQALRRVVDAHEPLNATWRSLSWLTPSDLLPMLGAAGATLGRDTALQGWTYRHMVYLFGIKQGEHLEHFKPQPRRWQQLNVALNAPSVYDDVLAFLHREKLPFLEHSLSVISLSRTSLALRSSVLGKLGTMSDPRSRTWVRRLPILPRSSRPGNIAT